MADDGKTTTAGEAPRDELFDGLDDLDDFADLDNLDDLSSLDDLLDDQQGAFGAFDDLDDSGSNQLKDAEKDFESVLQELHADELDAPAEPADAPLDRPTGQPGDARQAAPDDSDDDLFGPTGEVDLDDAPADDWLSDPPASADTTDDLLGPASALDLTEPEAPSDDWLSDPPAPAPTPAAPEPEPELFDEPEPPPAPRRPEPPAAPAAGGDLFDDDLDDDLYTPSSAAPAAAAGAMAGAAAAAAATGAASAAEPAGKGAAPRSVADDGLDGALFAPPRPFGDIVAYVAAGIALLALTLGILNSLGVFAPEPAAGTAAAGPGVPSEQILALEARVDSMGEQIATLMINPALSAKGQADRQGALESLRMELAQLRLNLDLLAQRVLSGASGDTAVATPATPATPQVTAPSPEPTAAKPATRAAAPAPAKPAPSPPKPVAAPKPQAAPKTASQRPVAGWAINLATMSTRQGAIREVDKLSRQGIDARVRQARVKGRTLYRVQQTGYATQAEATRELQKIRASGFKSAWLNRVTD